MELETGANDTTNDVRRRTRHRVFRAIAFVVLAIALGLLWRHYRWRPTNSYAFVAGVVSYIGAVIVGRWVFIAGPARAHFRQRIDFLRATSGCQHQQLLDAAANYAPHDARWFDNVSDFMSLNRGEQVAGWELVHSIERQLINSFSIDEVNARLDRAAAELKKLRVASAEALATQITQFRAPK
jgi:hypothetical protein